MKGLIVDFGGVLTTNVFDSFRAFGEQEGLDPQERPRAPGAGVLRSRDPEPAHHAHTGSLSRPGAPATAAASAAQQAVDVVGQAVTGSCARR